MKTLVFSDTHFTNKFNEKRFYKLKNLIINADRIIINGDFWEGFYITFDEFLKSRWKKLFPLLKDRETIYIYGNHDDKNLCHDGVKNFSTKAVKEYKLKLKNNKFFFIHGEEFLFPKHPPSKEQWRKARDSMKRFDILVSVFIQYFIFNIFGANFFPKRFNKMTVAKRSSIAPLDYVLVCGHSHKPQYNRELNFVDIGFFNYNWANYLLIDDDGNFEFKQERY